MLKRKYPQGNISNDFSAGISYSEMQKEYDGVVRRLHLDSSVSDLKKYIMYAFMGMEYLGAKYLHLDMSGFLQFQMANSNIYDPILIEIGEKQYMPDAKPFPPEIRLLFFVTLQTAVFVFGKIFSKSGTNFFSIITNVNNLHAQNEQHHKQQTRKMAGPNTQDLDDLGI